MASFFEGVPGRRVAAGEVRRHGLEASSVQLLRAPPQELHVFDTQRGRVKGVRVRGRRAVALGALKLLERFVGQRDAVRLEAAVHHGFDGLQRPRGARHAAIEGQTLLQRVDGVSSEPSLTMSQRPQWWDRTTLLLAHAVHVDEVFLGDIAREVQQHHARVAPPDAIPREEIARASTDRSVSNIYIYISDQ